MRLLFSLMFLYSLMSFGQSRWILPIQEGNDVIGANLSEIYDHGYLLLGWFGGSYPHLNWLIKTDINGMKLWEKTLGDNSSLIGLHRMNSNNHGEIYLSGSTSYYDPYRDPIVIKLNSCGEKEWCRVFNTPGNYDYSQDILCTNEGGCVVLLNNTGPDSNYYGERVAFAKLSAGGELIWQKGYNSPDTNSKGEILFDLLETPDRGFLMTGYIYYEDPTFPGRFWTHPYYIKVDSLGNFEWETIVHKEIWEIGGAAWSTTLNPDSTFFYSSISHYYHSPSTSCPALLKMDFSGNVIDIYDVIPGYKEGKLSYASFINDSTLAASAGWGNTEDSLWSRAVIIDTLGNLLNSKVLIYDLYTSIQQVTYDGKLVYLSNTYQNGQFSCFLTKLNQNLEDDTLYTRPLTFDSLCTYQIVSDTIVQDDCGLIVGVEEPGGGEAGKPGSGEAGEQGSLDIWPNPAREMLNVECLMLNEGKDYSIYIYDIFGRQMLSSTPIIHPFGGIRGGQQINVETYPPGVYIAILKKGFDLMESRKFVVVAH
jgi:hypothetical protein